mgnify:CR=1 FL=1
MEIYTNGQVTEYTRSDTGEKAKGFNIIITKDVEKEIRKVFHKHFGGNIDIGKFSDEELLQMVAVLLEKGIERYQ